MLFLLCKALLDHWELALYKYCILLLLYYYGLGAKWGKKRKVTKSPGHHRGLLYGTLGGGLIPTSALLTEGLPM